MDGSCKGIGPIVRIVKRGILPILQIIIPIALILMGTIDLGKAVIASDEKEIKEAQGRLIKRFIYAAIVFLMVTLVNLLMGVVATAADENVKGTNSWAVCWKNA